MDLLLAVAIPLGGRITDPKAYLWMLGLLGVALVWGGVEIYRGSRRKDKPDA